MAKKPVMLMILDGWGIAPAGPYNAATTALPRPVLTMRRRQPVPRTWTVTLQIIQTQSWRPAGKMWGCRQAR